MKPEKPAYIRSVAPARTCLFGDHQDYLGLPVIACAINRHISLEAVENHKKVLHVAMPDIKAERLIAIDQGITRHEKGDHLMAALVVAGEYGCIPDRGFDVHISGNIPVNSGISSSSALLVSWVQFLLEAYGSRLPVNNELIARMAYEAEVVKQTGPGGKMDQYSIGLGNIMYLETGDELNYELIHKALPGLIIAESGIPKDTIGLLSNLRHKATEAIDTVRARFEGFNIRKASIKDLPDYLNCLPKDLAIYFEAALINHDITQRALQQLRNEELDLEHLGSLINEHHAVLKNMLKITVPRIDAMIDSVLEHGALGAKIVGSGGGGSIVVLSREGTEDKLIRCLLDAGAVNAYTVEVDPGARIIKK